jgi:hypothetical protein
MTPDGFPGGWGYAPLLVLAKIEGGGGGGGFPN